MPQKLPFSPMTNAPLGPGPGMGMGDRSMQIRNIANQTKQAPRNRMINFQQIQAIPGGTMPVPNMQRAASLLRDNKTLIDRFVDRVLRKV